jgi:hypothetical protein
MNSAEDAMKDPSNDEIEPPSTKKLKLSTDVGQTQFPSLAGAQSSSNGYINTAEGDEIKKIEEVNPSVFDSSVIETDLNKEKNQHKLNNVVEVAETASQSHAPVASLDEGRTNGKEPESQQHQTDPNFYQMTTQKESTTNTSSLLEPSPTLTTINHLPPSKSPAQKRREALRGIVMGIKSPVATLLPEVGLDPDRLADEVQNSKVANVSNDDGSSRKQDEPHVIKRRAPKKDPKPRLPLENRVFYSKKEIDSATAFLVDKEDLCDCLPLDDCFLLGEMFWIFTVKQLELALDENSENAPRNLVKDMIAKFSNTSLEPNIKTSLDGSSPGTLSPQENQPAIIDLRTSGVLESERDALIVGQSNNGLQELLETSENGQHLDSQAMPDSDNEKDINTTQLLSMNIEQSDATSIVSKDTDGREPSGPQKEASLTPDAQTTAANEIEAASQPDAKAAPLDSPNLVTNTDSSSLCDRNIPRGYVMIKERISFWRESIASFRNGRVSSTQVQKRFRLDGPIKLLFPQATLKFFKSIQLETLWTFLALRKSETGAVCDLMHIWRRECKMSVVPDIGLGRHFLAIAARIETVLSAFPPIQENDRGWILDPISGITGAAHDFLIRDHKIMSGVEFLNFKTKQLADVLEVWRQDNGMEKLRGSGKVAMISAWKAYIKEALEVENDSGVVLDLSCYVEKVQNEKYVPSTTVHTGNDKHADTVVKPNINHKGTSELAMHSKMVLERVLGEGATALLRSGGVQTAAELFAVDITGSAESQLYKTLIETGIVDGMPAFIKAVQKWRETINLYLNKLPVDEASTLTNFTSIKDSKQIKVSEHVLPLTRDSAIISAPPAPGVSTVKGGQKTDSTARWNEKSKQPYQYDPVYDALSYTTKQFLASMGIYTAKDFLKTRSSELAVHFVPWRRSMGKPELKGMGSIASISGWKSQVRKKAKEMGLYVLFGLSFVSPVMC